MQKESSSSICMVHDTIGWKATGEYRPCAQIDLWEDLRPGWRGSSTAGHETDDARVTHQGAGDQEALGMRLWAMESHARTTRRVETSERGRRQAPEGRETASGHDHPRRGLVGGDGIHAPAGSISAPCRIQDVPPRALRADCADASLQRLTGLRAARASDGFATCARQVRQPGVRIRPLWPGKEIRCRRFSYDSTTLRTTEP